MLFSDAFLSEAVISTRSPRSDFPETLATSRPYVAVIDLTANSILRVMISSIAVKNAFWILS